MDIATMTQFFKCCSIINVSILIISSIIWSLFPGFAYNVNNKLFSLGLSKEEHNQIIYKTIGYYKIVIIAFNVVPYFALCCCISN